MYKPVRPRLKKTSITRSRNGCKSCRERRTKCDEQKPSCGTCIRLGVQCESVRTEFKFHVVTKPPSPCSNTAASSRAVVGEASERRPDRANQRGLYLPNIDLSVIESLQHTERDVFYLTYWEDTCLPAVHPMFKSITPSALKHQMLKDAILALSSCNMSRHTPDRRRSLSVQMGAFSPGLVHQTRSQLYYSSAIRSFASLTHGELISNAAVAFTVLVLFAYIESSMGNLMAFNCHAQGLESILLELSRRIGDEASLRAFFAAWMQIRFVVWWARAYYSILDVHRGLPSVPLPDALLQGCLGSIHERRVVILSIMCESHRLNSSQILSYWSRQADIKAPDDNRGEGNDGKSLQRTCEKLVGEARKLDNWILNLPLSEQPLMFDSIDFPGHACNLDDLHTPIYFQSHEAALNFAYYAVARIMQCTCTLHQLQYPNSHQSELISNEEEPWVRLLLRIAKGTDIRMSISRNNYTIGFSGLLLAAALRCQTLSLGIDIEAWLGTLQSLHPTEEGAFPVYQTLAVVKAINQRRTVGRDVFGVTLPVDDGGGSPKFTCYNSQSISTLLLHGRCSFSGALLTEPVGIIDSSFS
ncbi:hypothetical protein BJY01DRAFT_47697 [Aspergillus pseudoustus]|uniref:Zn(2)-C6 fungal-type domain-containing protein n=1 Tax=Aspergillus pseudoustus TaxID=1810923 RepID=A0ABR4JB35_9EURO